MDRSAAAPSAPPPERPPVLRAHQHPRAVLLGLAVLVALAFQGSRGLYESTEGRYAESAREMVRSGNYLEPTLAGRPHWTKPPLTYWTIAAGVRVAGANGWGARLPNAALFVLTVLLVAGVGATLWDPATGAVAGLVYLSSPFPAAGATVVSTDTLLTFFTVLTAFLYLRAWRSEDRARARWWIRAMWVAAGLGFLTKGPAELLPLMAIFAFDRLTARRAPLLDPVGLVAFAVVGLSWFAAVNHRHPGLIRYFIGDEVIGRTLSNEFKRNPQWYKPFVMYLPLLLLGQGAWLVPFARLFARERLGSPWVIWARIRRADAAGFLLLWLLLPAAVYWASSSRLPLYVLPLCAPLALAVARALVRSNGAAAVTRALRVAVPSAAVLVRGGSPFLRSVALAGVDGVTTVTPCGSAVPSRVSILVASLVLVVPVAVQSLVNTVAFGNLMVPIITKIQAHFISNAGGTGSAAVNTATFYLYAGLTFAVAIVFIVIAMFYKERELQLTSA